MNDVPVVSLYDTYFILVCWYSSHLFYHVRMLSPYYTVHLGLRFGKEKNTRKTQQACAFYPLRSVI